MSHEFDAVRAASGEPVQFCKTGGLWVDVHFVGLTSDGIPVAQFPDGSMIQSYALRMKPMTTKKWVLEFDSRVAAESAFNCIRLSASFGGITQPPEVIEREIPPTE